MKRTINFCGNCPFFVSDYDGELIKHTCNLSLFLEQDEYIVKLTENELETPEWCPIKKEECILQFMPFSDERINKFKSLQSEIDELEKKIDDYNFNQQVPISQIDHENLRDLYFKLGELHHNEEFVIDDDINKDIEEIRRQISTLEIVGSKLKETFENLGKM